MAEDSCLSDAISGVLANDTDADGDVLAASLLTDVSHGTLTLNADGSFTYTPDADFFGTDTFDYTVSDGNGGVGAGDRDHRGDSVNDEPVAARRHLHHARGHGADHRPGRRAVKRHRR